MFEAIYNSCAFLKLAFIRHQAKVNQYDPYQTAQLNNDFSFNPYYNEQEQVITQEECNEFNTASTNLQDEDEYYLLDEPTFNNEQGDISNHYIMVNKEETCPVYKKKLPLNCIYNMAKLVTDNAFDTLMYGAVAAYDFIWAEKKSQPQPQPVTQTKKMRGFGVDFYPLVERPAALQFRIDRAEKNIRHVCQQAQKSVQEDMNRLNLKKSYGGLPVKKTFDEHNWGFVENDCTLKYKCW